MKTFQTCPIHPSDMNVNDEDEKHIELVHNQIVGLLFSITQ